MPEDSGERRDTYDSRRIDGLEATYARLEERVENLREKIVEFRSDFNADRTAAALARKEERNEAAEIQRRATDATRSLRNSVIGGCLIAAIIAIAERVLS